MNRPEATAFEAAKEIVIAKMSNTHLGISREAGKMVGEYFQEIYKKVLEVTKDIKE